MTLSNPSTFCRNSGIINMFEMQWMNVKFEILIQWMFSRWMRVLCIFCTVCLLYVCSVFLSLFFCSAYFSFCHCILFCILNCLTAFWYCHIPFKNLLSKFMYKISHFLSLSLFYLQVCKIVLFWKIHIVLILDLPKM